MAMPAIPLYQIDAFTRSAGAVFSGNPAAVCPLPDWLDDALMQRIAAENNLSETAFFVANGDEFDLRWFTPKVEVPLCGHATLAAAHVAFSKSLCQGDRVTFNTKSGPLVVRKRDDAYEMDLPALAIEPCATPASLTAALGAEPRETLCGVDYVAVYETEQEITGLQPDFAALGALDRTGVIATAPGRECDFVSRFFAPAKGVNEDPVTGRAHCVLAPFWSSRLGRSRLQARQVSARGGTLSCAYAAGRVSIAGTVAEYMEGEIRL